MNKHDPSEVARLRIELAGLSSDFAEDGIVRTVLRDRIAQECIKQEKTHAKKARSKK
jgi:hypothetical protein